MAKMFYTIEEAAEKLGKSEDEIKQMVSDEQLEQFRDGDKLMFKREEVDRLSGDAEADASSSAPPGGESSSSEDTAEMIPLADTGSLEAVSDEGADASSSDAGRGTDSLELADTDAGQGDSSSGGGGSAGSSAANEQTDALDAELEDEDEDVGLSATATPFEESDATDGGDQVNLGASETNLGLADTNAPDSGASGESDEGQQEPEDPRSLTGISVFDADEVEQADPSAQTRVSSTNVDEDVMALDSVGSGSGLLDLTRESDDTSLGAELLDEIYPGSGEGSDSKIEDLPGSSAVFESQSGATATGEEGSGLEGLTEDEGETEAVAASGPMAGAASYAAEPYDPPGDGFTGGMLLGGFVALVVALVVVGFEVGGVSSPLIETLGRSTGHVLITAGALLILSILASVVGLIIGKALAK